MILVSILAFNSQNTIHKVVDALLEHPLRVVIVDNGSDTPIQEERVEVIRLEKGVGIIHGRNLGFTLRKKDEGVIALADDVIVPSGDWVSILEKNQDVTLALRPKNDIAFSHYDKLDEQESFPEYIPGAPTSFQCVHFPSKVLDKIGFIDERYVWGDDGYMVRKNKHGVLRHFIISLVDMSHLRGEKYWPLRRFYEELWRPGKIDGEQWDVFPVRFTLEDYNKEINKVCPSIWTMKREEWPEYYDMSCTVRKCFEMIWEDPKTDRKKLLDLCMGGGKT